MNSHLHKVPYHVISVSRSRIILIVIDKIAAISAETLDESAVEVSEIQAEAARDDVSWVVATVQGLYSLAQSDSKLLSGGVWPDHVGNDACPA